MLCTPFFFKERCSITILPLCNQNRGLIEEVDLQCLERCLSSVFLWVLIFFWLSWYTCVNLNREPGYIKFIMESPGSCRQDLQKVCSSKQALGLYIFCLTLITSKAKSWILAQIQLSVAANKAWNRPKVGGENLIMLPYMHRKGSFITECFVGITLILNIYHREQFKRPAGL